MGQRAAFALRTFVATTLAALILATLWYFLFDMDYPEDVGRYAFWSGLLGGFVALFAAAWGRLSRWPRSLRFGAAIFIGMGYGFLFCLVAAFPAGLILRRIDVPVMLIWPVAGMVGVAYGASGLQETREPSYPLSFTTFVLAIAYVIAIKMGLNLIAEPLDFARYKPPEIVPHVDKPFAQQAAGAANPCRDTVPPRSLASYGVALDSTTAVKALGRFSNVRSHADGKLYGRAITLWQAGPDLIGLAETYTGGEPTRALVEIDRYLPQQYDLAFHVFYADGYFDQFTGKLYPGSVTGEMVTAQAECANQPTDRQTITLVRDTVHATEARDIRALAKANANVYRRIPAPSYPDPPRIDGTIGVAEKYWRSDDMSAGAYTARFADAAQMQRWLELNKELIFAKTEDEKNLIASWIAIAPTRELQTYTSALFRGYSAKDGMLHLAYSKIPVKLAD